MTARKPKPKATSTSLRERCDRAEEQLLRVGALLKQARDEYASLVERSQKELIAEKNSAYVSGKADGANEAAILQQQLISYQGVESRYVKQDNAVRMAVAAAHRTGAEQAIAVIAQALDIPTGSPSNVAIVAGRAFRRK